MSFATLELVPNLDGLHKIFMRPLVDTLLADPEWKAGGYTITSAFRPLEEQQHLWDQKLAEVSHAHPRWTSAQVQTETNRWVARPGKSHHGPVLDGQGLAIDIGVPGVPPWRDGVKGHYPFVVRDRVDAMMARHNLYSPMAWEDWHFEPHSLTSPALPPLPDAQEAPVNLLRTTVEATPAGARVEFFGKPVAWSKIVGFIAPDPGVSIAKALDGSDVAVAFCPTNCPVEVSFQ